MTNPCESISTFVTCNIQPLRESNRDKDLQDIGSFDLEEALQTIVEMFTAEDKYGLNELQDLNTNLA